MKNLTLLVLLTVGFNGYSQNNKQQTQSVKEKPGVADLPNSVQPGNTAARHMVKMYPNPTNGGITIEGFVVNYTSKYTVSDVAGNTVMRGEFTGEVLRLDAALLNNGLYFIIIEAEKETVVLRMVKQ